MEFALMLSLLGLARKREDAGEDKKFSRISRPDTSLIGQWGWVVVPIEPPKSGTIEISGGNGRAKRTFCAWSLEPVGPGAYVRIEGVRWRFRGPNEVSVSSKTDWRDQTYYGAV